MFDTHMLNEKGKNEVREFKMHFASAVKHALDRIPGGRAV